jgi:hypothetical protein
MHTGVGSAEAGNPNGGDGEEPKGSGSTATATENTGQQPAGNPTDWAKAKGWVNEDGSYKTEDVLKSYQTLEKRIGSMVAVPDDKAKAEDRDAFFQKLGWPGKPEGYEFARPEGLPEHIPYDAAFADKFKVWANEAKLPVGQAQALHDQYVKQFADDIASFQQELQGKAKAAHETLTRELWGDPKSEAYIQNRDAAVRALRADKSLSGLEVDLKAAGFLTPEGHFTSPAIAQLLAGYGRQMQNDTFVGNGSGGAGAGNPFAKATENLTEQVLLKRTDPARARTLAAAAGWSEADMRTVFGS